MEQSSKSRHHSYLTNLKLGGKKFGAEQKMVYDSQKRITGIKIIS